MPDTKNREGYHRDLTLLVEHLASVKETDLEVQRLVHELAKDYGVDPCLLWDILPDFVQAAKKRAEYIDIISNLYPPDSEYTSTAEVGLEIVEEIVARRWRELPEDILQEIASAMVAREHRDARRYRKPF